MVVIEKGKLLIRTNLNPNDLHTIHKSLPTLTKEVLTGQITAQGREAMANLLMLTEELSLTENQFEKLKENH